MPKLAATQQSPAAKPAAVAKPASGEGPRNIANTAAAISDSTNEPPKTTAGWPFCSWSSVRPLARCQAPRNIAFEYQSPPSTNADAAAATTASQLTSGIGLPLLASLWP